MIDPGSIVHRVLGTSHNAGTTGVAPTPGFGTVDGMARILITGAAGGLGRAAAQTLLGVGHEVIIHARSPQRLAAVRDLIGLGASAVVADLADLHQTPAVADQVNQLGRLDAVIHNAGVYRGPQIMPVNVVAPYLLTALIHRPERLVYLSS